MNFNRVMVWLLRSRLHRLVSRSMTVLRVKGLKSGREFDVPVNYIPVETEGGQRLLITSQRDRAWWRNLREKVSVGLTYQGKLMNAFAQVNENEDQVAQGFIRYFKASPERARFFSIELTSDGEVSADDLVRLARERVIVWVEPT